MVAVGELALTSSPPFRAGIPTAVLQPLRWVRVADRLTARFTWHALRASPALIKVYPAALSSARPCCNTFIAPTTSAFSV